MAYLNHEPTPPPDEPPPAGFHTSTTPNQSFVPDSFTNLTPTNLSNPSIPLPTRPSSSNSFSSSENPWHCTECLAASTPLRRRGPWGRKTLCNACGIRYGKRMKEAKQAMETNNTNQQMMRIQSSAQGETVQLPPENEAAPRRREGIANESSKRRKLEKLSEGQYFNVPLMHTAAPVVSLPETGWNPVSLNEGIEMNVALTAAMRQELTMPKLTDNANPMRAEHSKLSRKNAGGLKMTTEPPTPSPPMSAYPRQPFPNHMSVVDRTVPIHTSVFSVPGGHAGMDFDSGDKVMESTIMRENVKCRNFAEMPTPTNIHQLTPTRLQGDTESADADETAYQRTFGEQDSETLAMQCMEKLARLENMSNILTKAIHSLDERIARFLKKNEELELARQQNLVLIEQLTNEKAMANTKQKLLYYDIAKTYYVLEHLR